MTVPLSTRQDIRELDATGVSRCEIARRLDVSRNTVARYADMADMSPAPPVTSVRPHPATDAHADWIDSVLSADRGAPRKQRHTAKRIYDRLVAERGYEGSYESVRRYVAACGSAHLPKKRLRRPLVARPDFSPVHHTEAPRYLPSGSWVAKAASFCRRTASRMAP